MANRIPEVSPVLDEAGLPLHGFCRFEEIRPYLLSCRAASRIPAAACTVIIALFPYRFPDDGGPPQPLPLRLCPRLSSGGRRCPAPRGRPAGPVLSRLCF